MREASPRFQRASSRNAPQSFRAWESSPTNTKYNEVFFGTSLVRSIGPREKKTAFQSFFVPSVRLTGGVHKEPTYGFFPDIAHMTNQVPEFQRRQSKALSPPPRLSPFEFPLSLFPGIWKFLCHCEQGRTGRAFLQRDAGFIRLNDTPTWRGRKCIVSVGESTLPYWH